MNAPDRPDLDPAEHLAERIGRTVYGLRSLSADVTGLVELADAEPVADALRLVWAELQVARRRLENVSKFLTHPASRRGEP